VPGRLGGPGCFPLLVIEHDPLDAPLGQLREDGDDVGQVEGLGGGKGREMPSSRPGSTSTLADKLHACPWRF
jgi:hypothetical protein